MYACISMQEYTALLLSQNGLRSNLRHLISNWGGACPPTPLLLHAYTHIHTNHRHPCNLPSWVHAGLHCAFNYHNVSAACVLAVCVKIFILPSSSNCRSKDCLYGVWKYFTWKATYFGLQSNAFAAVIIEFLFQLHNHA